MTMISYAQNAEDVRLRRAFPGQARGFYIDVGANDPVWCSVTRHFYDAGWHGINIEPGRDFLALARSRTRDLNLNVALSDHEGELTLFEFPGKTGLSTCSREEALKRCRELQTTYVESAIAVTTLAQVCQRYVERPIDFLKIDVEGHERQVLLGADLVRWRPRVIVIEAGGHESWESHLTAAGYLYATFDGINRYYVRAEDADLIACLSFPVGILDDFVPYHHVHKVLDLGPFALEVARRTQHLVNHWQRTRSVARRWLRAASVL